MDFTFAYTIAGTATNVVVSVEDAIVAEAQRLGADLTSIEAEAKQAVDAFVGKVTSRGFWGSLVHKIEAGADALVHDVEGLIGSDPTPPKAP